jgi:hypothetical protein
VADKKVVIVPVHVKTVDMDMIDAFEMAWQTYTKDIPESPDAIQTLMVVLDYLGAIGKACAIEGEELSDAQYQAAAISVLGGVSVIGTWVIDLLGSRIPNDETHSKSNE